MTYHITDDQGATYEVSISEDRRTIEVSLWGLREGWPFLMTEVQARHIAKELEYLADQIAHR